MVYDSRTWNFPSLLLGIFIGLLLMTLLVFIAYYTRSFLFTYCPVTIPICTSSQFFNNPGEGLTSGANINDILFLNDINVMYYKRVRQANNCVPGPDQTVQIIYPQTCNFTVQGTSGNLGNAIAYNSSQYDIPAWGIVDTSANCVPVPNSIATSGIPVLTWEPAPIT